MSADSGIELPHPRIASALTRYTVGQRDVRSLKVCTRDTLKM